MEKGLILNIAFDIFLKYNVCFTPNPDFQTKLKNLKKDLIYLMKLEKQ